MTIDKVSAVLVTRGNVDLAPILEGLQGFGEVYVWNNRERPDRCVWGRYAGAERARHDIVYVQDDDCVVDAAEIVAQYHPNALVTNMPMEYRPGYEGTGISLVGFGAVFHKSLLQVFQHYFNACNTDDLEVDEIFERECDRVFTALCPVIQIAVPVRHLEMASAPERMWREQRHGDDLQEIKRRIAIIKQRIAKL